jgi:hypothetical protein
LDLCIVELATNKPFGVENTKNYILRSEKTSTRKRTYVLCGFIATWIFAASPIRRSLSEKEP